MTPNSGTLLYHAADGVEAALLCETLEQNGIQAEAVGGALNTIFGDLGADALRVDIWVPTDRVQVAGRIVNEYFARTPRPGSTPWTCPSCREPNDAGFDVCWKCGAVRSG